MSPNKPVLKPSFDPIKFLELEHLEEKVKITLKPKLEKNISEYLLIRLLDYLPEKADKEVDFRKITTVEELTTILKKYLPNLEEKIKLILNDFKREYQKTYGRSN